MSVLFDKREALSILMQYEIELMYTFALVAFKFICMIFSVTKLAREPVIGLIKWLGPKGLKVCSYGEKCAEFKN